MADTPIEVIDKEPTPLAERPVSPLMLIQQAVEAGRSVEELRELVQLFRELEADRARRAFHAALDAFQAECPVIPRSKSAKIATSGGSGFGYNYADLEDIVTAIRPILHRHGLSYDWDSEFSDQEVVCKCKLMHIDGHAETKTFRGPTESRAGMSAIQKHGAALTYAERQSLKQALGLVTGEPDTDAAKEDSPTLADEQSAEIDRLLTDIGEGEEALLQYVGVERVADIPARRFVLLKDQLLRKLAGKKAQAKKS